MTTLELFMLLKEHCTSISDEGICTVNMYDYDFFVEALCLDDYDQGFNAYISNHGDLCFDINVLDFLLDDGDIEEVLDAIQRDNKLEV